MRPSDGSGATDVEAVPPAASYHESGGLDASLEKFLDTAKRRKCPLCCCCVLQFILIILIAASFKSVGPYKFGLKQNAISKVVELSGPAPVYDSGVHLVGFWNDFLTFPKTIQTIQYSFDAPEHGVQHVHPLHLRSRDAVPIHLEVSVQYTRTREELPQLFRQAMTDTLQENIFISTLRAELTKVMSMHNVADCWDARERLVADFTAACVQVLSRSHAVCWGLQFYRVHVDSKYEEELIATQVQKQQKMIEEAKKNAAEVRAATQVQLANYTNKIKVLEAAGAADRYNLQVSAQTEAETNKVNAEAAALSYVLENVRLPNGTKMTEAQLTEYQEALMLIDAMKTAPLYYGLSASTQYIAVPGGYGGPSSRRLQGAKSPQPRQAQEIAVDGAAGQEL